MLQMNASKEKKKENMKENIMFKTLWITRNKLVLNINRFELRGL